MIIIKSTIFVLYSGNMEEKKYLAFTGEAAVPLMKQTLPELRESRGRRREVSAAISHALCKVPLDTCSTGLFITQAL